MELKPFPHPENAKGVPRRVGVEIEFSGLDEGRVAALLQSKLGGHIQVVNRFIFKLADTPLGEIGIERDTAMAKKDDPTAWEKFGLEIGQTVIPVEIVSDPLSPENAEQFADLLDFLRMHGARGTGDGVLLAFGMHLNIEVQAMTAEAIGPTLRAYALMEDWLREQMNLDLSRMALPFIRPYPRSFIDAVADGVPEDMDDLANLYLTHCPSRNHGLDMLPIFTTHDQDRVREVLPEEKIGARPTFHWRLPDCRIDDPDWSLATAWNDWVLVEEVASRSELLNEIGHEWRKYRDDWTTIRGDFDPIITGLLKESDLI
ncbi:amidoligase family protein [Paracoccaceae bacterium GXU_MW_L88]